jgi:hypothetical protein
MLQHSLTVLLPTPETPLSDLVPSLILLAERLIKCGTTSAFVPSSALYLHYSEGRLFHASKS